MIFLDDRELAHLAALHLWWRPEWGIGERQALAIVKHVCKNINFGAWHWRQSDSSLIFVLAWESTKRYEDDPVAAMNQEPVITTEKHNIWIRGLFMVLMGMIYQLCGTLLFIVAVIQFVITLLSKAPNARLLSFGRSLGLYIRQIANYLSFATEAVPFPFSDWPSGE